MTTDAMTAGRGQGAPVEWPTVGLAILLYTAFGLLTWHHTAMPWWAVLPLGGYLVCLHGSLQHEVVHGHPTRFAWVNEAFIFLSLWLWLPFRVYRESHLIHHRDENLTCPINDPESNYVMPAAWARMGPGTRALRRALGTVAGRMILGPPYFVGRLYARELRRLVVGDYSHLSAWAIHISGAALVLWWAVGVCDIPVLEYVLLYAYPGLSLTVLRSYLEHRAVPKLGERTAIVEAGPVVSLLYLNNNLHAVHHAKPGVAWYKLPRLYRERRAEFLAANAGYRFPSYWEVVRRFLLVPKEPAAHPFFGRTGETRAA
ncbi:MAG TPA: fatty acid desaturase [Alphaproteobacteria bacterium]|nr:fatty acid desaturase [Alphaproteobacteria bacterium]